ncbi:hypothetical protein PsAD46_05493 [Pseudovibrio sp. Ad46]|uniref:hypothetical protein n=1 Tax=Pseudovibrio sp. Ad46 TaxID=989432 RepID=UPI0007AECD62|nr:hypothetical protein [Pseudovibrio sp. Ad46]KZK75757.1 hypothetical protein PsAD46_05493 [Pseudovibrio sp. Ad46]
MRSLCFILLAFLLMGGVAAGEEAAKKRVLIVSNMSPSQNDAFFALLEQTNPEIDGSFRSRQLSDADIVVYFLNTWSDAPSAAGAKELPLIFERLDVPDKPIVSQSVWATMNTGNVTQFIFYSLSDADYPPLECLALDLAFEAKRKIGEWYKNTTLRDCSVKSE